MIHTLFLYIPDAPPGMMRHGDPWWYWFIFYWYIWIPMLIAGIYSLIVWFRDKHQERIDRKHRDNDKGRTE